MKTIFILTILSALTFCLCGCGGKPGVSNTDAVSILYDITDPLASKPSNIDGLFGLHQDNSMGALFRLIPVSDIDYTGVQTYSVAAQNALLQNPGERLKTVNTFFTAIDGALSELEAQPVGKSNSEIFKVVARETNYLAGISAKSRTIYVYSNLYENTEAFSMYRTSDIEELLHNPGKVASIFENEASPQDLSGITINLIYRAQDYHDSQRFVAISKVYSKIFAAKHAVVKISASTNP